MTKELLATHLLEWTPSRTRLRRNSELKYQSLLGRGARSQLFAIVHNIERIAGQL